MTEWREDWDEEAAQALLAAQRLGQTGLEVKLDKGFDPGVYVVTVEYGEAAQRVGFTAAKRQALDYAARLYEQLAGTAGYAIDDIDDASHSGDPRRKRDLERSFLSFALTSEDGLWHDAAIKERFRVALLRADQERDQHQAGVDERRRDGRRERFRQRLETLLAGEAYRQVARRRRNACSPRLQSWRSHRRGGGRSAERRKECQGALPPRSCSMASMAERMRLSVRTQPSCGSPPTSLNLSLLVDFLCLVVVAKHIGGESQCQLAGATSTIAPFKSVG